MDIVVNLRNQVGQNQISGRSNSILGKEVYELFFSKLKDSYVEQVFLLVANESDELCLKIIQDFKSDFRFEPIVSSKLSDASLLKRLVANKKLKEHFVYFSQLCVFDFNMQDFIDYHKYNDSLFTTLLNQQPRSFTPYGYIYINNDKKLEGFNYKWLDNTDLIGYINPGIYAISRRAIDLIKNNNNGIKLLDDLLKHIVINKKRNYLYFTNGYINLLCTLEEYYYAHMDLLKGSFTNPMFKIDYNQSTYIPKQLEVGKNLSVKSPIMISEKASIGNNVTIINSIISGKCKIGNNVTIENSFIGEDVTIDEETVIKNTYLWGQYIPSNSYIDDLDKI